MQYFLQHGRLDRLEDTLAASRDTLGEAYQEARRAIEDLRLLPATSTVDWLLRLADDFRSTSGLQVEAAVSELRYELAPSVQAQLIRIVQEAFANIRRHSQAHRVTLSVVETEDALVIEIGDDGLGIDSLEEGAETHYGLVGMRERAELIGGELRVQGRQAGGTSVRLQLPLDPRLEK
jgi:signal transduction histidine kinase